MKQQKRKQMTLKDHTILYISASGRPTYWQGRDGLVIEPQHDTDGRPQGMAPMPWGPRPKALSLRQDFRPPDSFPSELPCVLFSVKEEGE
jgi:hypothetical protein